MKISKSRFYTYGRIAYPKYTTLYNGRSFGPPAFVVLAQHTTRGAAQTEIQHDWDLGYCIAVIKGAEILKTPDLFYWEGKERDPPDSLTILQDPIACPDVRLGDRFEVLGDVGTVTHVDRRRVTIEWITEGTVYSNMSMTRTTLESGLKQGTWTLTRSE